MKKATLIAAVTALLFGLCFTGTSFAEADKGPADMVLESTIDKAKKAKSKAERIRNVKGAYASNGNIQGKRTILVDDVVTTAATVNECAKVLKKAGASSVTVVTAARAKNS